MHSPGPWTVFNNGNNFFQVQSAAVGKGYYSTIGSFCQRDNHPEHGGRINTETAAANAQVAAAAPDLLDALDPETLEAIADELTEFKHSARAGSLRVIARKQREAITKATCR